MKKLTSIVWALALCIALTTLAFPFAVAALQLPVPTGQLVSGSTSGGTVYALLIDADGTMHITGSIAVTGTPAFNQTQVAGTAIDANNGTASAGSQRVTIASDNTAFKIRNTPAMTGYTTQASFTTNGLFLLQNTATNQATATTTLLQSMVLANNTASAVVTQVMDGNGRYLLGPSFSIAANSQYVLSVPAGSLMTGGINVSANTANALTVSLWGLQ